MAKDDYRLTYIDSATTTTIKTSGGFLHRIVVGTTGTGAITVWDGVDGGTSTQMAELKASITEGSYEFNCMFANGLYLITSPSCKISVIWR